MASCRNQHFCTLCLEDDITNEAVTWCIDCETFLCLDCKRHHKRSKASKDHTSVSVEEYANLPAFILKTSNRCVDHDKRYDLYCCFHGTACCVQCINEKHKECHDLPPITDVLGNIKSSAAMFHLERDLKDIKENFEEIEKTLSSKKLTLEKQKEKGITEIHRIRKLINDHLDKLEKELLDKLLTKYSKLKSKTSRLISEVKRRNKHIDRLREDFVKMKTFATDLQIFVGSKTIEEMKTEETKYIEYLRSVGKLNTKYLEVNMSSALNSIVNDVSSFGDISVRSTPASLQMKTGTEVREQVPVMQETDITQIKPKLKKIIKIREKTNMNITGCQILPGGQILLVDRSNKCLMLFSKDGVYIRDVVTFGSEPWNVCYITDNTVAVTLYKTKEGKVIDILKNEIRRSFYTQDPCYGIDFDQRYIIVTTATARNKTYDLLALDLYDKQVSKLKKLDEASTCVTCFENKIYVAYFRRHSVACYQENGKLLWTYRHEDINEPRSLSVDRHGFVYVCCFKNNKIVVLTPDGEQSRVILSHDDGLRDPFSLNIDRKTSTLLVGNLSDGNAFLFQI